MKRICAIFLSMLMLLSTLAMTVSANPVGFQENKVVETSEWINDNQLMVLSKVGVTTWNKVASIGHQGERNKEIVSRWFVAFYLNRLVKLDTSKPAEYEVLFRDLSSEHKYYNLIKGAVKGGYMKADADGYFRPNEPVTTGEAASALLKVLGYGPYIEAMGEAKALKITNIMDGIPESDKITQPQMLRMIYNALNAPAMRAESYEKTMSGMAVEYVIDENYLGFEHLYGVKHEVAILDGIKGSSLDEGHDEIKDGIISIDGVLYEYAEDVSGMLGLKVDYFYKENPDGTRKMVYLFASDGNKEFVLTHKDVDDFRDGVYYYADGNKTKTVELDPDVKVIFNGIANTNFDDEEMNPQFGKVTLINNDKDKDYDVVKVESYEFFYASSVDTENKLIYDNQETPAKKLDFSDADELRIFNAGEEIAITRLRANNLVAVKRSSTNSGYKKVTLETYKVSKKSVRVSSVGEDFIVTDGGTLSLWKGIADSVEMGKTYNLFIYEGEVVLVTEDETAEPEYAYLVGVATDKEPFSKNIKFAIVDMSGNYGEYEGAERIVVDGETYTDPERIRAILFESAKIAEGSSEEYPFAQPIRIDFNTKSQVNFIDTYNHNEGKEDENAIQKVAEAVNATNQYLSNNKGLYNLAPGTTNQYKTLITSVGAGTKIMFVPGKRLEEKAYMTKSLTNGETYRIDVLGRDPQSYVADVILVYYETKEGTVGNWTRATIISDLSAEYDPIEGETKYSVTGYYEASIKQYYCDEDLYSQLSVGDIYKFETDRDKKVVAYKKIFAIADDFPGLADRAVVASSTVDAVDSNGIIFGSLIHMDGEFVRISQSLPTDPEGYDPTYKLSNVYVRSSTGVLKYSKVRGVPMVEAVSLGSAIPYTTDPENPAIVIVNVLSGASCIYFIEK